MKLNFSLHLNSAEDKSVLGSFAVEKPLYSRPCRAGVFIFTAQYYRPSESFLSAAQFCVYTDALPGFPTNSFPVFFGFYTNFSQKTQNVLSEFQVKKFTYELTVC